MEILLGILPCAAVIFGLINGKGAEMSSAILEGAESAVTLALSLCGIMCLWCGIMKVAERAGIVKLLSKLLQPVLSRLFKGLKKGGAAMQLIAMNVTANLLGLGNATTPLGIKAMQAIAEEEHANGEATDSMVMLTVLNTASLQIIPTTAAALRSANGAENPMAILPCVWIVSIYSLAVAIGAAKLLSRFFGRKK